MKSLILNILMYKGKEGNVLFNNKLSTFYLQYMTIKKD